jgi:hypothetical protein
LKDADLKQNDESIRRIAKLRNNDPDSYVPLLIALDCELRSGTLFLRSYYLLRAGRKDSRAPNDVDQICEDQLRDHKTVPPKSSYTKAPLEKSSGA